MFGKNKSDDLMVKQTDKLVEKAKSKYSSELENNMKEHANNALNDF